MSRKTQIGYAAVIQEFKYLIKGEKVKVVMCDFEYALRVACSEIFPAARIAGCKVHYDRVSCFEIMLNKKKLSNFKNGFRFRINTHAHTPTHTHTHPHTHTLTHTHTHSHTHTDTHTLTRTHTMTKKKWPRICRIIKNAFFQHFFMYNLFTVTKENNIYNFVNSQFTTK